MIRSSLIALADQMVWASTNFVVVALVARNVSSTDFGLFAVALSVVVVVSGLSLSVSGEVLAVGLGRSGDEGGQQTARALAAIVTMALLGPVLAVAVVAPFDVGSMDVGPTVWVLVAAPAAILAEGCRGVLYASRSHSSVVVSLAWLVVQLSVYLVLPTSDVAERAAQAWAAGAGAACLVGVALIRRWPRWGGVGRAEWRRRRAFGFEFLASAGATHLTVLVAASIVGLSASGELRALQTVFGPLNIALVGLRNAVVPRAALGLAPGLLRRTGLVVAGLGTAVTVALLAVMSLLPSIGRGLMGDSWPLGWQMLWAFGLSRIAVAVVLGALVVLRATDQTRSSGRLRAVSALALLVPFALSAPLSIVLALWTSGVAVILAAGLWWRAAWTTTR